MEKQKKSGLNRQAFMAIISLAIAGSVIYELPYIKYVYYDSMLEAFNMTNAQSGFLLSMYAIGCMIFYIPGGIIADRVQTKKLMIISLLGTGVLGIALAFFMSYTAAVVIFFLFAISTSFVFWTALMKALRILGGKEDSGAAYGWYYALGSVVALVASTLFLFIYNRLIGPNFDNHKEAMFGVILAMGILSIVSAFLVMITYKNNEEAETPEEDKFKFRDLPKAIRNPYVWGAALLMFLMYAVYSCASYFTPYLTARVGMDVSEAGLVAVIRTYVLFFLSPIGGYIADKLLKSTLKFYVIGFICLGISFLGVFLVPDGVAGRGSAIAVTMISSAFAIMMYGIMWSILNELKIPVVYAGTAVGLCSLIAYTPDLFLHTIFGNWIDRYGDGGGYTRIFVCLAIFCVIAAVLSLIMAVRAKKLPDPGERASMPEEVLAEAPEKP